MRERVGLARAAVTIAASAIVLVLCAASCGGSDRDKGKTPTGARASCAADSDCVLTNESGGCCQSCRDAPHAIPTLAAEQHKNKCAAVDCQAPSDRIECPKVDAVADYVAKCKDGTCAAVKR